MDNGIIRILIAFATLLSSVGWAAGEETNSFEPPPQAALQEPPPITLYQVGEKGNYCLSMSKDQSGCVSGVDSQGNPYNYLDLFVRSKVVFENLSDAPHDMKFSGANAEELPAQDPKAADVMKEMKVVDLSKQKITCSFHGDQLGVGYRVPDMAPVALGHDIVGGDGSKPAPAAFPTGPMGVMRTSLADVSKFILRSGIPSEVQRLLASRPDLANPKGDLSSLGSGVGAGGSKLTMSGPGLSSSFFGGKDSANAKGDAGKGKQGTGDLAKSVGSGASSSGGADSDVVSGGNGTGNATGGKNPTLRAANNPSEEVLALAYQSSDNEDPSSRGMVPDQTARLASESSYLNSQDSKLRQHAGLTVSQEAEPGFGLRGLLILLGIGLLAGLWSKTSPREKKSLPELSPSTQTPLVAALAKRKDNRGTPSKTTHLKESA